jgi:hypothetical protein
VSGNDGEGENDADVEDQGGAEQLRFVGGGQDSDRIR